MQLAQPLPVPGTQGSGCGRGYSPRLPPDSTPAVPAFPWRPELGGSMNGALWLATVVQKAWGALDAQVMVVEGNRASRLLGEGTHRAASWAHLCISKRDPSDQESATALCGRGQTPAWPGPVPTDQPFTHGFQCFHGQGISHCPDALG